MTDNENKNDGRTQQRSETPPSKIPPSTSAESTIANNGGTIDGSAVESQADQGSDERNDSYNRLSKDHVLKFIFRHLSSNPKGLEELFAHSRESRVLQDENFLFSSMPNDFEDGQIYPGNRTVPMYEVINDCVIKLKEGMLLIEFESFIKPFEEMIKLFRSFLSLLLVKGLPNPKSQRQPFLLLIYTGARKFQDPVFWQGFIAMKFRVICLNELDAEKEIAMLQEKARIDPGYETSSEWVLFLLLFLPLAKVFDRKRLSDCSALALKILDSRVKEEYFNCMKALYGLFLETIDKDQRTTEENLIMRSTANPLPPEMRHINVVAETDELWELHLEYEKDKENALKAMEKAMEKDKEDALKAMEKDKEDALKAMEKDKEDALKAMEKAMEKAAAKLIREGMSLQKISEITGLPLKQVRSLEPA